MPERRRPNCEVEEHLLEGVPRHVQAGIGQVLLALQSLQLRDRDGETPGLGFELAGVWIEDGHDGRPVLGDEGLHAEPEA